MGILKRIRESFSANTATRSDPTDTIIQSTDPLIAIPANIIGGDLVELDTIKKAGNRYAAADLVYSTDERLYSSIELMAIMIEKSIGDISIRPVDGKDRDLNREEINAIKEGKVFAKRIKLKKLFYRLTIDLWKYGDSVDLIRFDSTGILGLQALPMTHITAVNNRDQINKPIGDGQPMIQDAQFYLVDEKMTDTNVPNQIYSKNRILHVSFNPERNQIRDNLQRWTMGIWSAAPIQSLFAILAWKKNLIRNDMIAGNRALPREDHELDLSQFSLDKFPGDIASKKKASKAAAETAILDYVENIKRREADQGFVHGQGTKITFIQPKDSYRDPSGQLDQINSLIGAPSGTPASLLAGDSKGFTSVVNATGFLALRAEIYAEAIQEPVEKLMRRHVGIARPGIRQSVVDRLYIKNRLILDRDRAELAIMISTLKDADALTQDELRSIWGLDPLTKDQRDNMIAWTKRINDAKGGSKKDGISAVTEDLIRKDPTSPTGDQKSSKKIENDRNQRGRDRGRKQV